jgi:hypothetical protein
MEHPIPSLDYETQPRGAPRCVLEMDADTTSLTLPLPALWLVLVPIGMSFALVFMAIFPVCLIFRENAAHGWPRDQWSKLAVIVVSIAGLTGIGAVQLYRLLRYRRVPSRFCVNRAAGMLSIRDTRSPRERHWPLTSIRHARVKRLASALPSQRVAELVISTRRPPQLFRFRIFDADIEMAEQFVACLNDCRPQS